MSINRRNFLASSAASLTFAGCSQKEAQWPGSPSSVTAAAPATTIEVFDSGITDLLDPQVTVEPVSSGYTWSEGPVWDRQRGCLYFNDVPRNTTWRWSEREGATEFLNPSGAPMDETSGFREPGANGLWIARDGRLLICNHGKRAIERMDLDTGERSLLASGYSEKRFNSPNDIVEGSDGAIFFTDPPYGLEGINESPFKEQDANGVYRLSPGGDVSRLLADMTFPNGIGLSPDERTLYIAQSDPDMPILRACAPDGSNVRMLFDFRPYMAEKAPGLPDGMAIAETGHIFQTGPGGVFILTPEGHALGRIRTGKATANCCFGNADGRTLYMTAHDILMRLQLRVRGLSWAA